MKNQAKSNAIESMKQIIKNKTRTTTIKFVMCVRVKTRKNHNFRRHKINLCMLYYMDSVYLSHSEQIVSIFDKKYLKIITANTKN